MGKTAGSRPKPKTFLGEMLDRFAEKAAISVMVRATMENALAPDPLDELFCKVADRQYTRELLFSTLVALMAVVVCRVRKSVHAAFKAMQEEIPVSLTALYDKLDGTEPGVSAALVRHSADRMRAVIEATGGALAPLFPGYRMKILDGNHLAATQRRIKPLRGSKAGPLPGFGLVVLDPALMLAVELIPCEDGHAQERSLTPQILQLVEPHDLWLADRNFCTVPLLFGMARNASFIVRQHGSLPWTPAGPSAECGRTASGLVTEQEVLVTDSEQRALHLRRITVHLDGYTRDGDSELHLLTNLPAEIPATAIADAYRDRWRIEGLFAELERNLDGEIDTLGYPKAALFAFAIALVAYNVLSTAKAAMRAHHGVEAIEEGLSAYYVADELSGMHRGMMVAVPDEEWHFFRSFTPAQLAALLVQLAANVDLRRFGKKRCGPRGPRLARLRYRNKQHVSTFRLLAAHTKRPRTP
jgi:hypothetical protein